MIDFFLSAHTFAPYLSAFMMGLLGGAHCIGMCGGLMSALSFSIPQSQPKRRFQLLLTYNMGRIASYSLIGAIAGWFGYQLSMTSGLASLRIIAGILLIAMGLYLANWWHGLTYLERIGALLWKKIQPMGKHLMPVKNASSAFLLGAIWGWLPCGLVYTALAYGLAQGSVSASTGVMLAFGLGTLPALLSAGLLAERLKILLHRQDFRIITALLIIAFGCWTIWGALGHGSHNKHTGEHSSHSHQQMPVQPTMQGRSVDTDNIPKAEAEKQLNEHHHH